MTIQELLQTEPYLSTDEKKTGIYLLPSGKFGFTAFPVGDYKESTREVKRELGSDFEMPKDISEEERHNIEFETITKREFVLKPGVVLVSPDQYEGLKKRTHCWDGNMVVPYVKPENLVKAEKLLAEAEAHEKTKSEIEEWLKDHDYIGVKISEALALKDEAKLETLREKYAPVIRSADCYRGDIRQIREWFAANQKNLENARILIEQER